MKLSLGLLLSASAVVGAGVIAIACGSTTSGGGGATAASYCNTLSSYAQRCGISDPCTNATIQNCEAIASNLSQGYISAVESCAQNLACGDAGAPSVQECLTSSELATGPTAAQTKLANDYCASCVPAAKESSCVQGFYAQTGEGGLGGPGAQLLIYGDTLITSIDTQCGPGFLDAGILGCEGPFFFCADDIVLKAYPTPNACTTPGDAGFSFDANLPVVEGGLGFDF
jgi:hypothetical protein